MTLLRYSEPINANFCVWNEVFDNDEKIVLQQGFSVTGNELFYSLFDRMNVFFFCYNHVLFFRPTVSHIQFLVNRNRPVHKSAI